MDPDDVDDFMRSCEQFKQSVVAFGAIQALACRAVGMATTNFDTAENLKKTFSGRDFYAVSEEIEGITTQLDRQ